MRRKSKSTNENTVRVAPGGQVIGNFETRMMKKNKKEEAEYEKFLLQTNPVLDKLK